MANKEKAKKISINAFENAIKQSTSDDRNSFNWNGLEVVVKKYLGLKEMANFVNDVVNSCFGEDNIEYIPEIRKLALDVNIVEYYTNLSLPANLSNKYDLLAKSNIIHEIIPLISESQFKAILNAIDEKIEYFKQTNANNIMNQINEIYNTFSNIQSSYENMFNGVAPSDLSSFITSMNKSGFTNEDLIKAVVESQNK